MSQSSSCASSTGTCWICLQDGDDDELQCPCKCPRPVHSTCLAKWQLRSAGRQEEKRCRFCDQDLPDWRPILTPDNLTPQVPLVSVHYKGSCYRLRIKPGPEGLRNFRRELQRITGLTMLECMQITFQCKSPDAAAQELCFKGMSAFDAAMHCASVSAAERLNRPPSAAASSRLRGDASGGTAAATTTTTVAAPPSPALAALTSAPPAPWSSPSAAPSSSPTADARTAATTSSPDAAASTSAPVPSAHVPSTFTSADLDLPAGVEVTRVSVDPSAVSETQLSSEASDSDSASSIGGEPGCIVVPTVPGGTALFAGGGVRSSGRSSGSGKAPSRPGHLASLWTAVRKWLA